MKKVINVGLAGAGTVGINVLKLVKKNRYFIDSKSGTKIKFLYICDIDKKKQDEARKYAKSAIITDNWKDMVNSPDVDVVIELTGTRNIAKKIIFEALNRNKHVVTANKAVLSENWAEIFKIARNKSRLIYFEASVAAGIPVIQALNEGLAANRVDTIVGLLNGTCNYILTKMTEDNVDFNTALVDAQKKGFAEPDPSFDIKGYDTLHKLTILSSIAWGRTLIHEKIYCEGISDLEIDDVLFAKNEFNYLIKLLGSAKKDRNDRYILEVRPYFVPVNHPFGTVRNEFNAVMIDGDASGTIIMSGKGAGGMPAASAVVSDLIFLSREISEGIAGRVPYIICDTSKVISPVDINQTSGEFYIRFTAVDKPGVLAKISSILAKYNVSIAGVYQKSPISMEKKGVPILMFTHVTLEGAVRKAIEEIDKLSIIKGKTKIIKLLK